MFWADRIAQDLLKTRRKHVVDDAKTPSGRVHMGALRGVIIHDLVFKALSEQKVQSRYTFIIDDLDPMDDLPAYLPKEKYEKYMGVPLKNIPVPTEDPRFGPKKSQSTTDSDQPQGSEAIGKKMSFAAYYALEFIGVFNKLGADPEILWSSQLYAQGKLDKQIKLALDNAEKIQGIYEKISGSRRPKDYYPFQPICEKCGKIGTTIATAWDGKEVTYECSEARVVWARGCGFKGKVSPLGGSGKLPFRVEWPAKWAALGVTVEGAGKDHSSKGGTRDTANAIAKEVFDYLPPYDIPYEHFLFQGKKMSSSKGVGVSAAEVAEILPPSLLRFLMVRSRSNQHIDFNPDLEHTIPDLFDDWDNARTSSDPDTKRIWELSVVEAEQKSYFAPRFRDLIIQVQLPNVDEEKVAAEKKGSLLTRGEKEILKERIRYVKIYLERFAPESIKFGVKEKLPEKISLSNEQKKFLVEIVKVLGREENAEDFQNKIYQLGKDLGLPAADIFKAIYMVLLGKDHGPKAAWLILSLDKEFVKKRFEEASRI